LAREFPRVLWLHWIHSAPEPHASFPDDDPRGGRFKRFPGGLLVYPNSYDVPRVARQYGVDEDEVRVVPHGMDYARAFDFHPLTTALVERYDLYSPDILAIYPIRMDRGKQPEKLVRLFSEMKKAGRSVRLLVLNFHSTGRHFIDYRDELLEEARRLGLDDDEVVFTNRIESLPGTSDGDLQRYRVEFPHKVVLDLFHLTNLYVHPSASETYSYVCQEAAACGNLLFLNDDFPPMRDIYGAAAHYLKFSSTLFTTTHRPDELAYYAEVARMIFHRLEAEKTVCQKTRIRQTRNLDAVFRNHLEPLLYANL
jgi:glycosyltransferase involved in cell wall biosynthesis